ncbi:MAG: hypothetical protein KAY24_17685, partial [Candidatus Eisenbacteria sp.]|nr:hypothetical protein [Candidatus Eisenbacteria bacterium]
MRTAGALLFGLTLLVGVTVCAQADTQIVPLAADETHLTLLEQEMDALRYSVELSELVAVDVITDEGAFVRLFIPGFHSSHLEGAPELPMMNRLIEIPCGASARVEVVSVESRSINLADYGIKSPIFPAQPSMPKNVDPADWPFVYDRDAYAADRVARDLVKVVSLGQLRAADIGRLEVSPIEYFPAENRILVHERIEFSVIFEHADHARGDALKTVTHSLFFTPIYDQIEGFRTPHDDHPDLVRDVVTLVVVTPPEFEVQLQEFVEWKIERGFHTILAVTGSPPVGSTKEEIQAYIHDLYNNATPELPAPSFVIFVGDVAQMPTWFLGGNASDRPYCDVEGDLVPDI